MTEMHLLHLFYQESSARSAIDENHVNYYYFFLHLQKIINNLKADKRLLCYIAETKLEFYLSKKTKNTAHKDCGSPAPSEGSPQFPDLLGNSIPVLLPRSALGSFTSQLCFLSIFVNQHKAPKKAVWP